jgi:hypothetical protein
MNTSRLPSIGPDPAVNRSGRALASVGGGCVVHPQFPGTKTTARNAIIDATPTAPAIGRVSLVLAVSQFSTIVLLREQFPVVGPIFEMLTFTSSP